MKTFDKKSLKVCRVLGDSVIQGHRFNAGIGNDWHIHYEEHIKYHTMDNSRVNFATKRKRQIFQELGEKINRLNLVNTVRNNSHFTECRDWIRRNIE